MVGSKPLEIVGKIWNFGNFILRKLLIESYWIGEKCSEMISFALETNKTWFKINW